MVRPMEERRADVRRLLLAAGRVYERRAIFVPAIAAATGLSPQGVELGFASLEREATDDELGALVRAAGDARHVHVVLSANVFVAALRALALARAAGERVTIRPSPRDPWLARALVEHAGDPTVTLTEDRDPGATGADAVHVYGRDGTIAGVRAQVAAGVRVCGHGPGLGIAVVTAGACLETSADALAVDVAAFDQRGCLSPRVVFVEGDASRARTFASALHASLAAMDTRVPRGTLAPQESAEAVRWREALSFAGEVWVGHGHAVGVAPGASTLAVPGAGRHVLVVDAPDLAAMREAIDPLAALVVTVGSDDPARVAAMTPAHARSAQLGWMQRPPLDGPVDRRTVGHRGALT